jgi:vomeronasal 2 receptor
MAHKETSLVLGMVSLILQFRWTWVGLFISEDHRGFQILSEMREEMDKRRICVAFVKMIPVTIMSFLPNAWTKKSPDYKIISKCDHHLW